MKIIVVFAFTLLLLSYSPVSAQCVRVFTPTTTEVLKGYRTETPKPNPPQPASQPTPPKPRLSHILVQLTQNVTFKVALDSEISSSFSKVNDYVMFSVLEDVYGEAWVPEKFVDETSTDEKLVKMNCVVIPKATKIYGLVDFANARYPFSIPKKAKIFIAVHQLRLANGDVIEISFKEPPNIEEGVDPFKPVIRPCKNYTKSQCIVGRREKRKVPTQGIGSGATAGSLLVENQYAEEPKDGIYYIAGLSFIESLAKTTGVDDLVNPPNAVLKSKMIFDVTTKKITPGTKIQIWIENKKPEEPKKPKEEEKN